MSNNKQKGYIALISVLLISSLSLVVAVGVSLRSINGAQMGLAYKNTFQAHVFATSCAHKALLSLQTNLEYVGNEDIIIEGDSSCHIYAVEGTGNEDRVIKTEASVNGFIKKIRVEVSQISPTPLVSSWKEIVDF